MHDTDMAGILYFARQFRFVHDALEDFFESEGLPLRTIFAQDFVFLTVHVEADYHKSLVFGDQVEVYVGIEKIGTSSVTISYKIFKSDHELAGSAKTIHVCVDRLTYSKIDIPLFLKEKFSKFLLEGENEQKWKKLGENVSE